MSKDNPHIDLYLDGADPEAIRFDGLDYAVVGTDQNGLLVYSYDRMIECFMTDQDMELEEAIEWIDYNVLGINGGQGFIVVYSRESI